ncbi:hypothetical protein QTP88_002548 [Uroleucon formosanum]
MKISVGWRRESVAESAPSSQCGAARGYGATVASNRSQMQNRRIYLLTGGYATGSSHCYWRHADIHLFYTESEATSTSISRICRMRGLSQNRTEIGLAIRSVPPHTKQQSPSQSFQRLTKTLFADDPRTTLSAVHKRKSRSGDLIKNNNARDRPALRPRRVQLHRAKNLNIPKALQACLNFLIDKIFPPSNAHKVHTFEGKKSIEFIRRVLQTVTVDRNISEVHLADVSRLMGIIL